MASLLRRPSLILLGLVLLSLATAPGSAQTPTRGHGAEARDMELVGHDDLQGRSAYQPTIHRRAARCHRVRRPSWRQGAQPADGHRRGQRHLDRRRHRPRASHAISPTSPGSPARSNRAAPRWRACAIARDKTYLLRTLGNAVPGSAPRGVGRHGPGEAAARSSTVVSGLTSTHKNWWECDTGIAYLVSGDLAKRDPLQLGPSGWRTWRMTKIYDLSDPAKPVFIRDFGLAGQEPGSTGPIPVAPACTARSRSAIACTSPTAPAREGMLQIVDRAEAPHGSEGADGGQPQRARDQPAPHVAELGWAHGVPGARDADRRLGSQHPGPHARLRRPRLGIHRQRVPGVPPRDVHGRHHVRDPAVLGGDLPGARVARAVLPAGRALRPALEQRVVRADLLPEARLHRLLQRRRAGHGHPQSRTRRARPRSTSRRRPSGRPSAA